MAKKTTKNPTTRRNGDVMTVTVTETKTYRVANRDLADIIRQAFTNDDKEYLDEIIGDLDSHEGPEQVETLSLTVNGKELR